MTTNNTVSEALENESGVTKNTWQQLRQYTAARISLGRSGVSVPTSEMLAFQLAHAQARDAVHTPLNFDQLTAQLSQLNYPELSSPLRLASQASDRTEYLQRPDLGRRLSAESVSNLKEHAGNPSFDLAIVVADGLSATAIEQNVVPFITALLVKLKPGSWSLAPITIVEQGRVAIGDEVGKLLQADCVLMLIGERPGLSSPDSLGLYLTWGPEVGLTDACRNCISNIRPEGLVYEVAVQKTYYLLNEARRLKLSGVNLKDRSETAEALIAGSEVIEHNE